MLCRLSKQSLGSGATAFASQSVAAAVLLTFTLQAALWGRGAVSGEIMQPMGLSELGLLQEKGGSFQGLLGWELWEARACVLSENWYFILREQKFSVLREDGFQVFKAG